MTVKRTHVLSTALSLFHRQGFSNIGVDRIVAEAKIAKMTFYKYFPSKIYLIEECLRAESFSIQLAIYQRLRECKTPTPLEKIKAIYIWHHDLIHSENFNGSLFNKAAGTFLLEDGLIFEIIDQHKMWQFNLIKQMLDQINIHQPETMASCFINMLDGMLYNAAYHSDIPNDLWPFFEFCLTQNKIKIPV